MQDSRQDQKLTSLALESEYSAIENEEEAPPLKIYSKSEVVQRQIKQVAQRATIAHLSPMCQGQISFQKTYKWAMETRGQKSNSSELLMPVKNERASMETPFSHYKYMGNFLDLKGS